MTQFSYLFLVVIIHVYVLRILNTNLHFSVTGLHTAYYILWVRPRLTRTEEPIVVTHALTNLVVLLKLAKLVHVAHMPFLVVFVVELVWVWLLFPEALLGIQIRINLFVFLN